MKKIFQTAIILFLLVFMFTPLHSIKADIGGQTCPKGQICLDNPLTGTPGASDINSLIGKAINAVLGLVGSIALVMFIYGGFVWMTAMGNKESVTKGKDIIVWSVAGLAVIFLAYAVVNFILADVIGGMGG